MAFAESPQIIFLGESTVLLLTVVDDDTGDRFDLSTFAAIEWEVKAADGDADPALISKAIGSGITLRPQSGTTLGQAEIAIATADTTTANPDWPAAPANVGVFRHDLIGIDGGGDRTVLVPPSDFTVNPGVNLP